MKINHIPALLAAVFVLFSASACDEKYKNVEHEWEWEDPEKPEEKPEDKPEEPVETKDWTDVTSEYGSLPEHIKIWKAPTKLQNRNAVAFIATSEAAKGGFSVWGINDPALQGSKDQLQTPMQVYEANGKPSVVVNAGFFYTSGDLRYSSSLEVSEGKLLAPNINYASEDWVKIYYPTRGVFLEHADGKYEAAWTYWKSATQHWIYQNPAKNAYGSAPLQQPTASFPEAGKDFEAVNGIGGGPVLIKNGEIRNTATEELFDGKNGIMVADPHPRTAIGITDDGRLVLFVCEGRNMTEGVPGFTTAEVAAILKDFGCVDALNLDGGGSSLMLVNGKELIKPSDKKERAVASCVYFK